MSDDPTHRVLLSALAIEDMVALHRWIAARADAGTADGYLDRVEARLAALDRFPDRGSPRDDLSSGLRTLSFERRLVIAYRVVGDAVEVLRVIDGARALAGAGTPAGEGQSD